MAVLLATYGGKSPRAGHSGEGKGATVVSGGNEESLSIESDRKTTSKSTKRLLSAQSGRSPTKKAVEKKADTWIGQPASLGEGTRRGSEGQPLSADEEDFPLFPDR